MQKRRQGNLTTWSNNYYLEQRKNNPSITHISLIFGATKGKFEFLKFKFPPIHFSPRIISLGFVITFRFYLKDSFSYKYPFSSLVKHF